MSPYLQQLASIDGITRRRKLHTRDCPWLLLESRSFYHQEEVSIDSLPVRPMRTWHCCKVDNLKVCDVLENSENERERGSEGGSIFERPYDCVLEVFEPHWEYTGTLGINGRGAGNGG